MLSCHCLLCQQKAISSMIFCISVKNILCIFLNKFLLLLNLRRRLISSSINSPKASSSGCCLSSAKFPLTTDNIVFTSSSRSTGLLTCPFIPTVVQASRSSNDTLAVIATIGKLLQRLSARILRVASRPSISGICISIRTTSYAQASAMTLSTPSIPPLARSTLAPSLVKSS